MRVFMATLSTESNTFSPIPTGMAEFTGRDWYRTGGSRQPPVKSNTALIEWRRLAEADGHTVSEGLCTSAQPGGTTTRATFEALRDMLLEDLHQAMPVDVVLLSMHGAMVAEGYDDCEGDTLVRVRAIVGPGVTVDLLLDLHCHLTERMRASATVMVAFKEYPHTDKLERAAEVYALARDAAERRTKPVMAYYDCRMIGLWPTTTEPMASFVTRMKALEGRNGVLSVSFGHGFPWGDVADIGAKVLVVADDDMAGASALAARLGAEIWEMRDAAAVRHDTVEQAMAAALAKPAGAGPVVLADIADNPGGGAPADSTFLLRALIEAGVRDAVLGCLWDPVAVGFCAAAGIGASLMLRIGGKCGEASGDPVDLLVTVRGLSAEHRQSGLTGNRLLLGASAWVHADGVDIVLSSVRQQTFHPDAFTELGLTLTDKAVAVVKSTQHFHAGFAPNRTRDPLCRHSGRDRAGLRRNPLHQADPALLAPGRRPVRRMTAQIKRRSLALMAASALVPARRAAAQARRSVLRFVPQSDLAGLDPVWTSAIVVRNHAYMVYDTLYGSDSQLQVRPQMAEGHESAADGLQWTIRLREGLRFHDGEPVRARDCVASIRRWAQRDGLGQLLMQRTDELAPVDDRSLRFRLKAPFPMLVDVLGKFASPVLFIMPERVALTPANVQNTDPTGSGPFRFKPEEAVQGGHFAYEAFTGYVPRDEPADNAAGGKRVHVAGVEWTVIPDAATAMSALRTGQVDWLEQPSADLLPLVEGDAGIATRPLDPHGSYVLMRFNHLYPPFDDVRVRQAVLLATDQAEFMAAMGGDPALARSCRSFFSCGTAEAEEAPPSAMPADVARARALVQASGHDGQPVLILSPSDKPYLAGLAAEAADLMIRIGLKAEIIATDWASSLARRASQKPPKNGGWNIFFTTGSTPEFADPGANLPLRGTGRDGWPGWFTNLKLEDLRHAWLFAADPLTRRAVAGQMQDEAFVTVPYVPLGQYRLATAYRRKVSGVVPSSAPLFWNLELG